MVGVPGGRTLIILTGFVRCSSGLDPKRVSCRLQTVPTTTDLLCCLSLPDDLTSWRGQTCHCLHRCRHVKRDVCWLWKTQGRLEEVHVRAPVVPRQPFRLTFAANSHPIYHIHIVRVRCSRNQMVNYHHSGTAPLLGREPVQPPVYQHCVQWPTGYYSSAFVVSQNVDDCSQALRCNKVSG